jgi:predicted HicB family RNase H-like nuclease
MSKKKLKNIEESIDNLMGVNQLFRAVSAPINSVSKSHKNLDISQKDDIKPFNIKLPKHVHKHMKNLATDTDRSINDLLVEAIMNYYKIKNI